MTKIALGKGLGALIPDRKKDFSSPSETANVLELDVSKILPNTNQPRLNFDQEPLEELISSIKEKGIIQPIVVRPKGDSYELIAGERRLRAAKSLDLQKVPVLIKNVSDEEALELSLIENIQRENLNPIEEAKAYAKLMTMFELNQDEIAVKVGKDRTTIANSLRLLKLPSDIQDKLISKVISTGHAKVILGLESASMQQKIVHRIIKEGLSVRATEHFVARIKEPPVHKRKMAYKDQHITALEEHIQQVLGTKVTICQGKKKGKIEIEYYSSDDLNRILDYFGLDPA